MRYPSVNVLRPDSQRLTFAMLSSLAVHAFVLFGIAFVVPDWKNIPVFSQPLEVVLVNSKSSSRPNNATAYAQSNLDGGGNTEEDRHAKTPFPAIGDAQRFTPEQTAQRLRQLEQESKRLLTRNKSDYSVAEDKTQEQQNSAGADGRDLVERSLEIARLEAQIRRDYQAYQERPKRQFVGARAAEYRFAQYVDNWRLKVERIGNLNYPTAARQQHLVGNLLLTVSIRADGSLENVEINRSSGKSLLDAAAIRIVRLAAPFSPLPPNIRRDTDILSITRTWTFTENDKLQSE